MQDFHIDLQEVKELCGNVVYNRAEDMYFRNKIRKVDIKENNENIISITSIVESAYDIKNYKVSLIINKRNSTIYKSCSCESFDTYKICKHIGATLIKLHRDGLHERRGKIKHSEEQELLEFYKNNYEEKIEKENINLDITLVVEKNYYNSKENHYYLEFKVGSNRLYVIKNIREFIEGVFIRSNTLYFGKELEFNRNLYKFRNDDYEILKQVKDIYDMNAQVNENLYRKSLFLSGKRAVLTENQLLRFLKEKQGSHINLEIHGENHKNIAIVVGDLPISFYMYLDKDSINIELNEAIPKDISKEGGVYLFENKIYLLSQDEKKAFKPIYDLMVKKGKGTMKFNVENISQVANYILPEIRTLTPIIIKDDNIKRMLQEEPLKTSFYLDKKGDFILCDIKFTYGEESFSYNSEAINKEEQKTVIRNLKEERSVVEKLIELGFRKEKSELILNEEEDIVEFLTYGVEEVIDLGKVYYSDSFKEMKILTPKMFKSSISLNNSNLLEFSFNIEGINEEELKSTFSSLKQKKKYHRLKNGAIIPLKGEEIKELYSIMDNFDISLSKLAKGNVTIPKYASLYIDEKIREGSLGFINRNKEFRNLINTIKEINEVEYSLPEQLKGILRGYQEIGFKWFKTLANCGFGGILGDEMGLGKTLQAISYIVSEKENGTLQHKALIVCPTSLVYNWVMEFEKFSKDMKVLAISGNKGEREAYIESIEDYDVIITSYALIRRDIEYYENRNFSICIIDEAQHIKNPTSQSSQAVKSIRAKNRFALTGTPIENSLTELWSIFDFIMPGYLKSHGKFVKSFEGPIIKEKDEKALGELLKLIRPFILRRFKKDVALELPPKIEHKVVVEMTDEQKKIYSSYVNSYKEEMKQEIKENGFNKSKIKILALLTRLRQICCDPSSFIENYNGDSGKYLALEDILDDAIGNDHRVLLFSQFTTVLGNIRHRLSKRGIECMYLDGSIPSRERMDMVNRFNSGEASVFLISLKAGGTGLNLTGADTVIHFDPWWNPAVEEQAQDRAHRIGQSKTVEVIKLIAKGTIEEKIYNIQEMKKEVISKVLDGENHNDVILSSMTENEFEELFS